MAARCPACGRASVGGRFCAECGSPLAGNCPTCGSPTRPEQKFCAECGTALASPPAAGVVVPAAGRDDGRLDAVALPEVRLVSVLFVDLVGFTALSEQRDAEDVRDLLGRYFELARTIVRRHGAVGHRFIGDAVMAVWGSPVSREDDAERAVRAALDLVEAVRGRGAEVGAAGLRARAGVVTGRVAALADPDEGLVVGDRVNTAARIQAAAEPDTVYVDGTTRQVTAAAITYADAGEHLVKGKTEPLRLWRATRVVAGVAGSQRVDGLEASFVGRDFELRQLKEFFHAAADRRAARLVAVVGAAGVGKSRLRWEFEKYTDGLADDVLWHAGRCLSYGEGVAFWALAEMVRQRFGIAEGEPAAAVVQKLADGLTRWVPDEAEQAFLAPRVGALLGVTEPGLSREELFAGWRLLFERLSDDHPVLLVFEDMQWADAGLFDFLEHLLDWSADHPIVILTFARPELADRRPGWAAGRRNAGTLYLDPLTDDAMGRLLDDLVPGLPPAARARIVQRAEGIPLYGVETIRTLVDRDVVVPRGGSYALVGEFAELDVPASLTSLLAARLDALDPAERALAKDLSVIGGTFSRAAAGAISDLPADQLDRLLAQLVRKEVLTVRADRHSPDRGQYAFTQAMLRTVARDLLSKRERKARHLAVAEHLRSSFPGDGEDVAEAVAAHYHDAYLAAGAESGAADSDAADIRVLAAAAFTRAGQRAAAVGAPEAAEAAYRRAAELATDEAEIAGLLAAAADSALRAGGAGRALELFQTVVAAHTAAGRTREAARLTAPMAAAMRQMGRLEQAIPRLRDAIGVLETGPPDRGLAEVTQALADALLLTGNSPDGAPYVERASALAEALELPDVFAHALSTRGNLLAFMGRSEEALFSHEASLAVAERHGLVTVALRAQINIGDRRMTMDLLGAAAAFEAARAGARRMGDRFMESLCVDNLMLLHLFDGAWDEAERIAAEVLDSASGVSAGTEGPHSRLAVLYALRGDLVAARGHLDLIAAWADSGDTQEQIGYAAVEATVALADGDPERALAVAGTTVRRFRQRPGLRHEGYRQSWPDAVTAALTLGRLDEAEALLDVVGAALPGLVPPYLRGQLAHLGAMAAAARGRHGEVEADLTRAEQIFTELGYPYPLARTQLDRGRWLLRRGRPYDARTPLSEAAATFRRLGARPHLERAESALAGLVTPA